MKWFRLWHEWGHDPKIQIMPEHMQRRHIMLLCLRRQTDTEKLTDKDIAHYMRISLEDTLETKALFEAKGFIDNGWCILKWTKRQTPSDLSTDRVRKFRKKQEKDQKRPKRKRNALEKRREEREYSLFVDLIWSSYPRSCHKYQAREKILARLNAGANPFELQAAATNYSELVTKEKRERKMILMGKTFFGSNEPWLDYKDRIVKCIACGKECLEHERNEADACKDCC